MEVAPPTYCVVLMAEGPDRLAVMRALRGLNPDLSLAAAKTLIDSAPQAVLWGVRHYDLDQVKYRLRGTGGVFEYRRLG
jgi:ribosomal protein L7/L12